MEAREFSKSLPMPFELSLRIRHPSVDPAHLSSELGIKPKHSFRAGEPRRSRSDRAPTTVHAESYWLATLPVVSPTDTPWFSGTPQLEAARSKLGQSAAPNLGLALSLTATRFFRVHAPLFQRIRAEGGEVNLLIALSPSAVGSFSLAPEVSRVFCELGITLEFEMSED